MTDRNTNDIIFEQAKALLEKKSCQNRVYKDEPLLFTASRLLNEDDAPDGYKEMLKLSDDPSLGTSDARRFYEQAKLMADFEEDENYIFRGRYNMVYPAFAKMNIDQLRGYFSWRTRVKHGRVEKTETGFVTLYISEIINLIGVEDAVQGFDRLTGFIKEYSRLDSYFMFQGLTWAKNFAIYYGIPPEKYNTFAREIKPGDIACMGNDALCVLVDFRNQTKDDLIQAIFSLSTYNIAKSKWVKMYPEEATDVIIAVYTALYDRYADAKTDFIRHLFPLIRENSYPMKFNNLFYQQSVHPDCIYRLSPLEVYECRGGMWTCTGLQFFSSEFRSPDLGMLLKTIDCHARAQHGIVPPLQKPMAIREIWDRTVIAELKKYAEENEKREKERQIRAVKIDKSLLDSIRRDSEETRDKLLTGEETADDISAETKTESIPAPADENESSDGYVESVAPHEPFKTVTGGSGYTEIVHTHEKVFSPEEIEFISLILSHGNLRSYAKQHSTFVSAYADKINAITLDIIGDTVIDCDGDTAEITEDYIDEIKEMCGL